MEQIFGASLSMVGVTFSSKAQYTNNTKLTWTGQSRGSSAKRLAAGLGKRLAGGRRSSRTPHVGRIATYKVTA
jgi:hypothetical protein